MAGLRLGIDFGTTRTVVAWADRGNYPIVRFMDDAGDAHDWVPSVVAERSGELRFGFDAIAAAADPSFTLVRSFKRWMGAHDAVPGRLVRVGATELPLLELVTRFLASLRDSLARRSNVKKEVLRGSLQAVVATPANAHGAQRFVTLDAFRRAGFEIVAMLNEPSAAGFEYTHRHRETVTARRDHVVVYDLGGGTFDASLVRMRGHHHEVLATAGVNQLGGDDFDDALARRVLVEVGMSLDTVSSLARARLLDQCRDAKERLSPSSRKITIDLDAALGDAAPRPEATVSVASYYEECVPLVARSIEAMAPVMTRMDGDVAAEGELGLAEDVAGIYVVGGASELPIIARALRQRFGRRVHRSPYPSAAIAIGLAIASDESADFELADRYTRTFGVFREAHSGDEITFDPIFTRETKLPAHAAEPLRYTRAYRAAHNVGHFRFFECSALGDDGKPRGDMVLFGDVLFPFDPRLHAAPKDLARVAVERVADAGSRIEEEYALDEHGIVLVTIKNVDAGYAREYRLGA